MSFKRPPHISTSTPVRSSDRRKLIASLSMTYPHLSPEDAKSLVPDGILVAKFTTHTDTPGQVYISPPALGSNPLFFSLGKPSQPSALLPTIYTLSVSPLLLPTLQTHPHVISRMVGGADLMTPGLSDAGRGLADGRGRETASLKEGELVGVRATGCEVPLAIGRIGCDGDKLAGMGNGKGKGKAVDLIHCWNDHLWLYGKNPIQIPFKLPSDEDDEEPELDDEDLSAPSEPAPVPSSGGTSGKGDVPPIEDLTLEEDGEEESAAVKTPTKLAPSDVDTILRLALLQYISSLPDLPPPPPANLHPSVRASLPPPTTFLTISPIPSSTFYASHILPLRPHWAPAQASTIAQSTHKKVGKWLKAMEKEGLVKLKGLGEGVTVIGVERGGEAVKGFKGHGTLGEKEEREKKRRVREEKEREEVEEGSRTGDGKLQIREVWKPTSSTMPFWSSFQDTPTDTLHTLASLRSHLQTHIASSSPSLIHPRDPSFILLPASSPLALSVLKKGENVGFMKREEVLDRLRSGMTAMYGIRLGAGEEVLKKGVPGPVVISSKKRQSKFVTLITGLESYGIDPKALAEDLKKICASSTTVTPLSSAPTKANLVEVLVQGTHANTVLDLLAKAGVPRRYVKTEKGK